MRYSTNWPISGYDISVIWLHCESGCGKEMTRAIKSDGQ